MTDRAATPSETFRAELQAARQRKGWTQQDLADRLKQLDAPIDRTIVAKLESGRRGVSIEDVFTLALALGASPTSLLLPRGGDLVQIAPNVAVLGWQAAEWMEGVFPLTPDSTDLDATVRFYFDSCTDTEERAARRWPTLREIRRLAAKAVRSGGTPGSVADVAGPLDETLVEIQEAVTAERRRTRRAMPRIMGEGMSGKGPYNAEAASGKGRKSKEN